MQTDFDKKNLMPLPTHYIKAFFRHLRHAHARGGFGVHSPFVFHWLTTVLYERTPFYAYQSLANIRKSLLKNRTKISLQGFGTGHARKTEIRQIVRQSCAPQRQAELLLRIANASRAKSIVELGTNVGLSTLYLAAANQNSCVTTFEGEPQLHRFATQLFAQNHAKNITAIYGEIDQTLPDFLSKTDRIDLAFFDANHTAEATLRYFDLCLPKAHTQTIFIFHDIHLTADMELAWNTIKKHSKIRATIDTFCMGIAFFNADLQKEDFVVKF